MYIFSTKNHDSSCPVCGFKITDLYKDQKLGCSFCYLFLEKESKAILKSYHNSSKHIGKKIKKKNLLKEFFEYAIKEEMDSKDSNSEDCKNLIKLLREYF